MVLGYRVHEEIRSDSKNIEVGGKDGDDDASTGKGNS